MAARFRPRRKCCHGPKSVLCVWVLSSVVMVMMVMAVSGSERRTRKHRQKQGCEENLFHATNVALSSHKKQCLHHRAPRKETSLCRHVQHNPRLFLNLSKFARLCPIHHGAIVMSGSGPVH